MKHWFKHNSGFINLDENNLYFTHSGNWSEVAELKEKSARIGFKRQFRKGRIAFYMVLCIGLGGLLYLANLGQARTSLILVIGLPIAVISLFRYLNSELGPDYLIPLSKLERIEVERNEVRIHFIDGDSDLNFQIIAGVDARGLELLMGLMDRDKK